MKEKEIIGDEIHLELLFAKKKLENQKAYLERQEKRLGVKLPTKIEEIDKKIIEVKTKISNSSLSHPIIPEESKKVK